MEKDKIEINRRFTLGIIVYCLFVSIISGVASGWYFSNKSDEKEIVMLDVVKIIETKKKEFIEKYKDQDPNPRMREEMDREISSFVSRLNQIVEEESRGKVVLTKESIVSNVRDITDEVSKRIKNSN